MAEFAIGQTVVANDDWRVIYNVDCDGIVYWYDTYPLSVKKRVDADPALLNDASFRSRYCQRLSEQVIVDQTRPKTLRVPTQMGVIVVRVSEPTCAIPAIITSLELPDGTERELSKVFGFQMQDKIDIYLKDGNVGRTVHKATYTEKSLNIQKEK
jgi:hypothetical protein